MKFKFSRHGIAENPIGAHVTLRYRDRDLIGTVVDVYRDEVLAATKLVVRHFNGEPWPIEPSAAIVNVLKR